MFPNRFFLHSQSQRPMHGWFDVWHHVIYLLTSPYIIFKNDCNHWVCERECGGCQRGADIFFAAVKPAKRMSLCWSDRFKNESSFRSNSQGQHGISVSSKFDKMAETSLQKDDKARQSQNMCIKEPIWPLVQSSQFGEGVSFIRWILLGVR